MSTVVPAPTGAPDPAVARSPEERVRLFAAVLAFAVGLVLLGAKLVAWHLTGSSAVLSDALESIVNVVAALFAIGGVIFAGRPADRGHPYGHGKIEFFTAAFEGGLISFAAVLILIEAARALLSGAELRALESGIALLLAAGLINGGLGWYLIRTGRKHRSLSLEADGKHVLTDFFTSLGVVVGLLLVRWTGLTWLDPLIAGLVAASLIWTGWRLVRHAAGGLLDEEDTDLLRRLVEAAEQAASAGVIRIHNLRVIRAGRFHHVDAHLVLPEFWDVRRAHDVADAFEKRLLATLGVEGEVVFHADPCRELFCRGCDLSECPVRNQPFVRRPRLTVEEAVHRDPPLVVET